MGDIREDPIDASVLPRSWSQEKKGHLLAHECMHACMHHQLHACINAHGDRLGLRHKEKTARRCVCARMRVHSRADEFATAERFRQDPNPTPYTLHPKPRARRCRHIQVPALHPTPYTPHAKPQTRRDTDRSVEERLFVDMIPKQKRRQRTHRHKVQHARPIARGSERSGHRHRLCVSFVFGRLVGRYFFARHATATRNTRRLHCQATISPDMGEGWRHRSE